MRKTRAKAQRRKGTHYLVEIGDDGGEFRGTAREALDLRDEFRQLAGGQPVLAYKVIPMTRRDLYEDLADERVGLLTPAGRAAARRRAK